MKPIIEVNHVTKEYQLGHITSLKENVFNAFRRITRKPLQQRENFKALDDVNFTIEQGEVVGIIGHNGAGKSTLLKHLASISKPTKGKVIVRGSIAPLIEVGAGVNPELTGRENIFLNGAILGIPKKIIQQKLDEIIDFSELAQFIDTPVKRYSSGMTVKLGFSIATSLEADILIIDEVLAVGDLAFQRKCFNRMENLIHNQGRTVLVVSHNYRQLEQICTRMIMLNKGRVSIDGKPTDVCTQFIHENNEKINTQQIASTNLKQKSDEFELVKVNILDVNGICIDKLAYKEPFKIRIEFKLLMPVRSMTCFASFHTTDFIQITANESFKSPKNFDIGHHFFEMDCSSMTLLPGIYSIKLWIGTVDGQVKFEGNNLTSLQVYSNEYLIARLQDHGLLQLDVSWNNGHINS